MTATERRKAMLDDLRAADGPLSGSRLAKRLGVSRQVVVQDIALLRADGNAITATSRGYVLDKPAARPQQGGADDTPGGLHVRTLKMHHTVAETSDELLTIVGLGGRVLDVSVSHRVYGKLQAKIDIATREDVLRFVNDIESGKSSPLLTVTSGYHYHRIAADSEEKLNAIERALDAKGYLAPLLPHEQNLARQGR